MNIPPPFSCSSRYPLHAGVLSSTVFDRDGTGTKAARPQILEECSCVAEMSTEEGGSGQKENFKIKQCKIAWSTFFKYFFDKVISKNETAILFAKLTFACFYKYQARELTGNVCTLCSNASKKVCKICTLGHQGGEECACVRFSSGNTGIFYHLPNWTNLHATIPDSFRTAPSHPRMPLHVPHKLLIKFCKQMARES